MNATTARAATLHGLGGLGEHPRAADARNDLAALLKRRGDATGAEESFQAALRVDPQRVAARYDLGNLLLLRDDAARTEKSLQAALHSGERLGGSPIRHLD